ncbi:MAG: universal stress protein [Chloroflexota bacterium]|nr:universal stress protein [Chloroflexota bacterium]MDE3193804.1 universal stress protein [Chloroflexota bacterium]
MAYKRILVPLAGSAVDPDVVRLAVSIGKAAKAQLLGVHVIEVRWNLPLDAILDAELDHGEGLLAGAARIAAQAGGELETELLQAREAAAAIIDTAHERACDLILLGMPYRRRLGRTYVSRTVEEVYLGAHCAVLAYRQEASQ